MERRARESGRKKIKHAHKSVILCFEIGLLILELFR